MIFLTVGTCPQQFDRLIKAVDKAVGDHLVDEEVVAQIGACNYSPKHMKYAEIMDKSEFDACFSSARYLVGHAGMGTISMSLEAGKPLLVLARRAKYGEHVNDHQVSTADMFGRLGHVLVAHNEQDVLRKIAQLKSFVPCKREATPHLVADRISRFLADCPQQD